MQPDFLFIDIFFTSLASFIILAVSVYSFTRRSRAGAMEFGFMTLFFLIFALASLAELYSRTYENILLWRNISQIGNFFGPVVSVVFALSFSGYEKYRTRALLILSVLPATALTLIFTNPCHHLVRSAEYLSYKNGVPVIVVKSTALGMAFVALNFILMASAVIILLTAKTYRRFRFQNYYIAAGLLISSGLVWLKVAGLLPDINITVLYVPGLLTLVWALFRRDLLAVSPVARDKAFVVMQDAIVVCADDCSIVEMNPAAYEFFASIRNRERVSDDTPVTFQEAAECMRHVFPSWAESVASEKSAALTVTRTIQDDVRHFSITVCPLTTTGASALGTVSILRDVTAEIEEKRVLTEKIDRDGLSGLYNQTSFKRRVLDTIENPENKGRAFSVMMLDVDDFKKINDFRGHSTGDEVIRGIARELKLILRGEDIIARYGGEEFTVLLADTVAEQARIIAEKIRTSIYRRPFSSGGDVFHVTVSIGVASFTVSGRENEACIMAADQAMYSSKRAGKNRVTACGC